MAARPVFRTHEELVTAAWPDCRCGHPAHLHGLMVQHVGGSGCFKTWWKEGVGGSLLFDDTCRCEDYRPVEEIPS